MGSGLVALYLKSMPFREGLLSLESDQQSSFPVSRAPEARASKQKNKKIEIIY